MDKSRLPHSVRRVSVPIIVAILCMALIFPTVIPVMADDPVPTTTILLANPNSSVYGQPVTFTVTVIVTGTSDFATGTVNLKNGDNLLGSDSLDNGSAFFSVSNLPVGNNNITAEFIGGLDFAGSTFSVIQTVEKASTSTVLTSSNANSVYGESVVFSATVSAVAPGAGTPTGGVTFKNGDFTLGTGQLNDSVATYNTTALEAGAHEIKAEYAGDGNFNPSNSSVLTQTVSENESGYIWDWGYNNKYQLGDGTTTMAELPLLLTSTSNQNITSLAGGLEHSLAADSSGHIYVWGDNASGQLGINVDSPTSKRTAPVMLEDMDGVIKVAAGSYHSLVLKSDGTVWSWGQNSSGQLGINSTVKQVSPVQVLAGDGEGEFLTGIKDIAAGNNFSAALAEDGSVYTWGSALQTGTGITYGSITTPVKVKKGEQGGTGYLSGIKSIAAGYDFCLAVGSNGIIWAWGSNNFGQLGNGGTTTATMPVEVINIINAAAVAAGQHHSLAITTTGMVYSWGLNDRGQLGINSTTTRYLPAAIDEAYLPGNISAVSAGYKNSLALDENGIVWSWGDNTYKQVGDGSGTNPQTIPVVLNGINGTVLAIASGAYHQMSISSSSSNLKVTTTSLKNAARNSEYEVRVSASGGTLPYRWEILSGFDGSAVKGVLSVTDSDFRYCTLIGTFTATGTYRFIIQVTDNENNTDIQFLSIKVTATGQGESGYVWDWGYNNRYQLGNGGTSTVTTPRYLSADSLENVIAVAGGTSHSLALKSDGTVWACGDNTYGQLGIYSSSSTNTTFAQARTGSSTYLSDIIAVAAGANHSLALDEFGNVWACGDNTYGQLGINSTATSKIIYFTKVVRTGTSTYLSGIEDIAAGANHSLALDSDGYIWSWGRNNRGQLGIDTTDNSVRPVQVSTGEQGYDEFLTDVASIAAGYEFSLAADIHGQIWSWGDNTKNQLGSESASTNYKTTPIQVDDTNLTNAQKVAAGYYHSLALDSEGRVWSWGSNQYGQLGMNWISNTSTSTKITPQEVYDNSMDLDITSIAAGHYHSLALDTDRVVWSWGYNNYGQLGDGTTTTAPYNRPIEIDDVEGQVYFIAAGANHSLAISDEEGEEGSVVTITTTSLSSTTVNYSYSTAIYASGGTLPYQWDFADSGSIGNYLDLDSYSTYCTLSGTFDSTGTYYCTLRVTDNHGYWDTQDFTIYVSSSGSGGGGGGGGSGTTYYTFSPTGFTSTGSLKVNQNGVTQSSYQLQSMSGELFLSIPSGTYLLNSSGSRLTSLSTSTVTSPPAASSGSAVITAHNLLPNGASFNPYITLKMYYDQNTLPAGVTESNLYLAYHDGSTWQKVSGTTVDINGNTVTANIAHFSTYAILGTISTTPTPSITATPTPTITQSPTPTPTVTKTPAPTATTTTPAASSTPTKTSTPKPSPTTSQTPADGGGSGFNWWILIGIIGGLLVISLVLIIIKRRRSYGY